MKAQEKIKNDEINLQADVLIDLAVSDEQADEIKGGEFKSTPQLMLHCAQGSH